MVGCLWWLCLVVVLLRLIAAYCGLFHVGVGLWRCASAAPLRLFAAYCGILRLIAPYCGPAVHVWLGVCGGACLPRLFGLFRLVAACCGLLRLIAGVAVVSVAPPRLPARVGDGR